MFDSRLLRDLRRLLQDNECEDEHERHHRHRHHHRHLSSIKIAFAKGRKFMIGPVTLTVGQKTTATVFGFDQNGAPFAIDVTKTPITWSVDDATLDSSTPQPDGTDSIVSLAAGVANLTASLTSAEGKALSDTEAMTNVAQPLVLSSIKIDFSTPA
jgi:hypothetical protein